MFSRCHRLLAGIAAAAGMACAGDVSGRVLRVCADPNNLPFSNQRGEGFENRLAQVVGRELGASVEYTWWPGRKSFLKNTLLAGKCDVAFGVPEGVDTAATTPPYYRAGYVLLSRADRRLNLASFDDPAWRTLKVGVHVVGDDYAPPAYALARRGMAGNLTGFSLFGPAGEANPPARLVDAVVAGDVDLAIVWGPLGGYFAAKSAVPLTVSPLPPAPEFRMLPVEYAMAAAVRKNDLNLKSEIDRALRSHCGEIRRLLDEYAVPRTASPEEEPACGPAATSHSAAASR